MSEDCEMDFAFLPHGQFLKSHLDQIGGTDPLICYASKPLIVWVITSAHINDDAFQFDATYW